MKRCPKCRRDYFDDSLLYCLDDGAALLEGPSSDEPATAVLPSEEPTRHYPSPDTSALKSVTKARSITPLAVVVAVVVFLLVAGFYGYRYFGSSNKQIESVAVMPFINESGDAEIEFLCDGMTESLIGSLSRLPNLAVKARNSVFRYKGRDVNTKDVARELSVQAVLTGRIRNLGERIYLRLELVDPSTETVIWQEQFERNQSDLVALQSEIARNVATELQTKLSGEQIQKVERRPTTNNEAYQLYLRARFEWNKRQKESLLRAVDYLKQAIAIDPNFALAHAGLADCYIVFNTYEVARPSEAYPLARISVQKALELDPELSQAYSSLAAIHEDFDWDFPSGERNYRRSIELDPNYAGAHQWLGEFLRVLGRFEEAVAEGRRAIELDPVSLPVNNSFGVTLFYASRFDEAIAQLRNTLELDPTYPWPYARIADCYTVKGMYNDAADNYKKAIELSNHGSGASWVLANYGYSLAASGKPDEARKIEQQLRERQKTQFVEGDDMALLYYGLGDLNAAFEQLDRGYKERSPAIRYVKFDPRYDDKFRSDPRYAELIRKIGLGP